MAHGRIETTPEQQLAELRLAYARYASLAERWKDSADPLIDAGERQAREQDARRIAHAYEKSIENTALRIESLHHTQADGRPLVSLAKGLGLMLAAAIVIGGAAAAYLRPEILQALTARLPARALFITGEKMAGVVSPSIAPPMTAMSAPPAPGMAPTTPPAPAKTPAPATTAGAPQKTLLLARNAPQKAKPQLSAKASRTAPADDAEETRALNQAYAPGQTFVPPRDPFFAQPPPPATLPAPQIVLEPLQPPALADTAPMRSAGTRLVPVMRTHLLPPYPPDAKRAGEHGTTQMEVAISALGAITDCRVTATSGSLRLDATACSFVRRYWRWLPPTRDGQQVPATTEISVIWSLIAGR